MSTCSYLCVHALPVSVMCVIFSTQRKHLATYDDLQKKKQASTSCSSTTSPTQLKLTDVAICTSKFERNHPRQKAITDAIAKMIIKDIQPVYTVERQSFHELLALLASLHHGL